jgi:hypothetical protein
VVREGRAHSPASELSRFVRLLKRPVAYPRAAGPSPTDPPEGRAIADAHGRGPEQGACLGDAPARGLVSRLPRAGASIVLLVARSRKGPRRDPRVRRRGQGGNGRRGQRDGYRRDDATRRPHGERQLLHQAECRARAGGLPRIRHRPNSSHGSGPSSNRRSSSEGAPTMLTVAATATSQGSSCLLVRRDRPTATAGTAAPRTRGSNHRVRPCPNTRPSRRPAPRPPTPHRNAA